MRPKEEPHPAERPQTLELSAQHDLSASQSEAARSECVVPENNNICFLLKQ